MGLDALLDRAEAQAGRDRRFLVHPLQVARAPRSHQRKDHAEDEGDESADGHALRHEADDLWRIQSHRLELADPKALGPMNAPPLTSISRAPHVAFDCKDPYYPAKNIRQVKGT